MNMRKNSLIEQIKKHNQEIAFFATISVCFTVFIYHLTQSPLWYDEAIEYWFSKIANGTTPGWRMYNSMYERICSTYQPPLYNYIMHCWLFVFDTEFGFRLLGAVVMTIGCAGIYAVSQTLTSNIRWSVCATILYTLLPQTVYYAQECAEYYLMLCFTIWMLFFFLKSIRSVSIPSLAGFYICACLAVCSQYGAAFIVAGLWFPLTIFTMKKKNRKLNTAQATLTFLSVFAVALPLYIWFLRPQMQSHITSLAGGHLPDFWINPIFDFLHAIYKTFYFSFLGGRLPAPVMCAICFALLIFALLAVRLISIDKKEDAMMYMPFAAGIVLSFLMYYLAVIFKFYAYTSYGVGFGFRWGLAFMPVWYIGLLLMVYLAQNSLKNLYPKIHRPIFRATLVALSLYAAICTILVLRGTRKDSSREVAETWYSEEAYKEKTIVSQWEDAAFQFYLVHSKDYRENYQQNIITFDSIDRTASTDELLLLLEEKLGKDLPKKLYFVGRESNENYLLAFKNLGYERDNVYNDSYSDHAMLIRYVRIED